MSVLPPKTGRGLFRMVGDTYSRFARSKPIFDSDPVREREKMDEHYRKVLPKGFTGSPAHQSFLKLRLGLVKGELKGTVVEIGCADGWFTREFAKLGHQAIGIDYSSHLIGLAKQYSEKEKIPNADFLLSRGEQLPLKNNCCDTVFCQVLEHVAGVKETLKESYRVLRPGGKIIITLPTYLVAAPDHRRTITREQLSELLAPYAKIERFFEVGARRYGCIAVSTKKE